MRALMLRWRTLCLVPVLLWFGCDPAPRMAPPDAAFVDAALGDAAATIDLAAPATMPGETVLRVHYPTSGRPLFVRGSSPPLSWDRGVAMEKGADDTWTLRSRAIAQPTEWKPLVDDQDWSHGANYRVLPERTAEAWPHFYAKSGKVVQLFAAYKSPRLALARPVWAYLPPSYDESPRARYPVVYMHDGQNLFDDKLAFSGEWKVDETLDTAYEGDSSIREAIVIGIGNTTSRVYEYTPTVGGMGGGGGDAYLDLIALDLKPAVDGMLRTLTRRDDTVLIGSSLGGLISSYAGTKHAAVFGRIGAMSPSVWWDNGVLLLKVAATKGAPLRPSRVYVDSGDAGPSQDGVADTKKLVDAYRGLGYVEGIDLRYVVQKGATHSERYWAERLPAALNFLLGPRDP